ncbi:hypothetical protein HNR46_004292 [Haloferula luteola]|uniref:Uncharacterized protein n=1 Tax=Haloferula luteola TaxID=595692 RepID=A0A840VJI3_9BACT|nr:hypothetical protein [Haloferula luteola]
MTASRAALLTMGFIALASIMALVISLESSSRSQQEFLEGPVLLLDEIESSTEDFDGSRVVVACYLWLGVEGPDLSSVPSSRRWKRKEGSDTMVCQGTDMLAQCGGGWSFAALELDPDNEDFLRGERLVVVEGRVHGSGYGPAGSLLHDEPYIEVLDCRPVLRAGGRSPIQLK